MGAPSVLTSHNFIYRAGNNENEEICLKRIGVIVQGRVQGVGYRMFVQDVANRFRISGWVRNREDGTVEAALEGEDEAVQDALEALYARGSHIIRVDKITVTREAPVGEQWFEIRG